MPFPLYLNLFFLHRGKSDGNGDREREKLREGGRVREKKREGERERNRRREGERERWMEGERFFEKDEKEDVGAVFCLERS